MVLGVGVLEETMLLETGVLEDMTLLEIGVDDETTVDEAGVLEVDSVVGVGVRVDEDRVLEDTTGWKSLEKVPSRDFFIHVPNDWPYVGFCTETVASQSMTPPKFSLPL
jgi:hypothetical protein